MVLILKHRKSQATMKYQFKKRGWVFMFRGFINATDLEVWKIDILLSKAGDFHKVDPNIVPLRILKLMKVDLNDIDFSEKKASDNYKACATEGCNGLIKLGVRGSHLRKYCDKCKGGEEVYDLSSHNIERSQAVL